MPVAIVVDSACSPSARDLDLYKIELVPARIIINDKTYRDIMELHPDELYRLLPSLEKTPTTAAPSPASFQKVFLSLLGQGFKVICFTVTAALSTTYSTALQARAGLGPRYIDRVAIIDTHTAGAGAAVLVKEAARLAQAGFSLEEILTTTRPLTPNCKLIGMVNTLQYLKKSGRVGKATALAGEVLRIKPVFSLQKGKVTIVSRSRGKTNAVNRILDTLEEDTAHAERVWVSVTHAGVKQEGLELVQNIKRARPNVKLDLLPFTSAMGVHTGPGLVGIGYTYR